MGAFASNLAVDVEETGATLLQVALPMPVSNVGEGMFLFSKMRDEIALTHPCTMARRRNDRRGCVALGLGRGSEMACGCISRARQHDIPKEESTEPMAEEIPYLISALSCPALIIIWRVTVLPKMTLLMIIRNLPCVVWLPYDGRWQILCADNMLRGVHPFSFRCWCCYVSGSEKLL